MRSSTTRKALVAADLYSLLDAHCVVGAKMRERIATLNKDTGTSDDEPDASRDDTASTVASSSSSPLGTRAHSSAPGSMMTMMTCGPECQTVPSVTMVSGPGEEHQAL